MLRQEKYLWQKEEECSGTRWQDEKILLYIWLDHVAYKLLAKSRLLGMSQRNKEEDPNKQYTGPNHTPAWDHNPRIKKKIVSVFEETPTLAELSLEGKAIGFGWLISCWPRLLCCWSLALVKDTSVLSFVDWLGLWAFCSAPPEERGEALMADPNTPRPTAAIQMHSPHIKQVSNRKTINPGSSQYNSLKLVFSSN